MGMTLLLVVLKIANTKISVIWYNLICSGKFHKKPLVPGSHSSATDYAKEITRSSFFFTSHFLWLFLGVKQQRSILEVHEQPTVRSGPSLSCPSVLWLKTVSVHPLSWRGWIHSHGADNSSMHATSWFRLQAGDSFLVFCRSPRHQLQQ